MNNEEKTMSERFDEIIKPIIQISSKPDTPTTSKARLFIQSEIDLALEKQKHDNEILVNTILDKKNEEIRLALENRNKEVVELYNRRIEKYKNDPTLSDRTKVALIVEYEYLINKLTNKDE